MRTAGRAAALALAFVTAFAAASAAEYEDTGKVIMWEVKSDAATAYVLGSLHFTSEKVYPLNPAIESAFDKSSELILEIDISGPNQMKAMQVMMQAGMYQGEETLSAALSEETLAKLAEFLKPRGMQLAQVDKMRPWFVTLMLAAQESMRLGYSPQSGIDMHFFTKAASLNKPVKGLETVEEQAEILSSAMEPVQEKGLLSLFEEVNELKNLIEGLSSAWKAGDAAAINAIVKENLSDDADLQDYTVKLLDERNVRMADRIAAMLSEEKTIFVVIGSAHLVTDESVLSLLADKGFSVTQVDKAPEQEALEDDAPEEASPEPESEPASVGAGG